MLRTYRFLPFFFIFLLFITIGGFYQSYFGLFPKFDGLPFVMHLHAFSFLIWFALLIVQPILIMKKRVDLHRILGKLSYFVVAVILVTILAMTKFSYHRELDLQKLPKVLTTKMR